ncbi:V-type ATP synthase subunit I [Halanaerobium sp. ST460_2HS_T2]|uniref:V-type ATP synthase subunit I n=1 Tax=Halanaerobium sp. ST460_2HS_T2 TaxID=2183914 RepID=UPI000DF44171|nr:V-type ATPase 116kDa subunit family protein [Halanaerobium sp. ST460_2HS_T2]RCW62048.1 V/A-type H+-transporting ATPase subunit I [Halanaerobium sp. ST460_2HS_T2]
MGIKKMKKFQILGLKRDIDSITEEMMRNSEIELLKTEKYHKNFKSSQIKNSYKSCFNELDRMLDSLNLSKTIENIDFDQLNKVNLEKFKDFVQPIQKKINKLERITKKLDAEEKRLNNLIKHVYVMRNIDIELQSLKNLSYITLIFGSLSQERYERLIENVTEVPVLVLEVNRDQDRVWFFTFAKKNYQQKALDILNSANFQRIELPDRVKESPKEILNQARHRLDKIEIIRDQINLEFKKLKHRHQNQLLDYYQQMLVFNKITDVNNSYYGESNYFFITTGWISEENEKEFEKLISDNYTKVIYSSQEVKNAEEENPPTIIENPEWIKSFTSLVKLYGLPKYGEIDPSLFFALSYILLFGIMFGDLGQGFVFVSLGFAIYKNKIDFIKNKDAAYILISIGFSSMVFGIFYGSLFGLEDLIPALIIRPMDNIMFWLGFTVMIGIFLLITSMIFNLFNTFKNKDYTEALFSDSGLSGLILYLFLLSNLAYYGIQNKLLMPAPVIAAVFIILLLLIFLKEPLGNLLTEQKFSIDKKISEYILESAFELFDTVLSYLSNTLSFLRVGAFTLNHVGLSMAVIILSEMINNNAGSLLVLVVGNIVIMILEGVVVGIQILRLEFFEIFAKFYSGSGRELKPLKIE